MTDEIENILKVLESDKTQPDEKAKAYRNLNTLLKDENEKDSIYFLCSFLNRFLRRFLFDIQNGPDKVVQVALRVLGFVIHSANIVTYYNEGQIKELVALLVRTITTAQEKVQCQLAVWCVSVQALNLSKTPLQPLVEAVVYAINSPFKSPGIETEAMSALGRLIVQVPQGMLQEIALWAPPIFTRLLLVGDPLSAALREKAEMVWRLALPHLSPAPEHLSTVVFEALTSADNLFDSLLGLLALQDKEALHAVRVWGYLILALGKYLLKGDLINHLLKIPNKTFLHASTSVRIATFHNWRCLIDNFSDGDSLNSTRRLKLLMMPFYNSITKDPDVSARQAGFMTWAYLVSKVACAKLLDNSEVFKQVILSYLTHVVRDSEPDIYNLGLEAAGLLLRNPEAIAQGNSHPLSRHTTLDILANIQLEPNSELLQQQNAQALVFFLSVVQEAGMKSSLASAEPNNTLHPVTFDLAREVWRGLVQRVSKYEDNKELVSKLVVLAGELCSKHLVKYSAMIYEELLTVDALRKTLLSSKKIKLQLDKDEEVIPIVYLSAYWILLGNITDVSSLDELNIPDEFIVGFDRILSVFFLLNQSATISVLQLLRIIVTQIHNIAFSCNNKAHDSDNNDEKEESEKEKQKKKMMKGYALPNRGQLVFLLTWAIIAQKASALVTESSADVFGKINLSTTMDFVTYALVLPLQEVYTIPLPPHIKTAWTNLFITYHRTASMKMHGHQGTKELCTNINMLVDNITELVGKKSNLSELLVMAVGVIVSAVNLHTQSDDGESRKKHSKSSTQKDIPIPQIPALPPLLALLLNKLHEETNPSSPQLLRSIAKAFSCQTTSQDLECTLESLRDALVLWVKEPNPKSRDSIGSPNKPSGQLNSSVASLVNSELTNYITQIKQAVDELWQEFISSVKRVYSNDKFSSTVLDTLAPLLVAALSNKHRQIKNSAIQFWNETFARTKSRLIYPNALLPILASLKEKTNIELPWFPKQTSHHQHNDNTKHNAQQCTVHEHDKDGNNTPSIPLEDQTLPPITDVPVIQTSGLRGIALSIKQENKRSSAKSLLSTREDSPKKPRVIHSKSSKISASQASVDHKNGELMPQPVPSEDPTPPSPPLSKNQLIPVLADETKDPDPATPSSLLGTLSSVIGQVTATHKSWTNQQLLWAQKQALRLADLISDELSQNRTLP
eukprot:Phypoly_transcript_01108.p1 GENE.Phypoly_transcript_01108~~Phypoly_transcript_01108.p1  ORF type:complete len:1198 (-),score=163.25 Phypoly_transcript_01108:89-3652(-)